MSRSHFGGTSVDWLLRPYPFGTSTTLVALQNGTTVLDFYSAETGGTHYTDLLDEDGAAATQIAVTDFRVPDFQGPDGVTTVWADKGDDSPRDRMAAQVVAAAGGAEGAVSFKTSYFDIPNSFGSTTWTYLAIPSAGVGGAVPYFGGYNQSGTGTGVEELSYDVVLRGGTWTFYTFNLNGSNLGKYTILVDAAESTSVDTYAAAYANAKTAVLAGTTITDGTHTITVRKKGTKHASSTDYYILWSGVMGLRTGP